LGRNVEVPQCGDKNRMLELQLQILELFMLECWDEKQMLEFWNCLCGDGKIGGRSQQPEGGGGNNDENSLQPSRQKT
jgi:hypothetical protein